MIKKIQKWYDGEYRMFENDTNSSVVILAGWYERHWTARICRIIVEFYLREWKWIIGTSIAVVAVAYKLMI